MEDLGPESRHIERQFVLPLARSYVSIAQFVPLANGIGSPYRVRRLQALADILVDRSPNVLLECLLRLMPLDESHGKSA